MYVRNHVIVNSMPSRAVPGAPFRGLRCALGKVREPRRGLGHEQEMSAVP